MNTLHTDVAVIGAGTAGMGAWRAARAHTDRVLLIEGGAYGTTCARVGCMPSKLLIAAAEAAHGITQAGQFGVHGGGLVVDGQAVMRRVRAERDRFVGFVVDAVQAWPADCRLLGQARFLSRHRLQVGDHTQVQAQRIVIATGSSPSLPPGWRERLGDRLITSDQVFDWTTLPAAVAVVGAGVIGLELAQALHRLGVRVRLYGRAQKLGPLTDPALQRLALELFGQTLPLALGIREIDPQRSGDQVAVRSVDAQGAVHEAHFDLLLATTGRRPNVDGLGLHSTGLPCDAQGVPVFDRHTGQIGDSAVFIAGDVADDRPLLHEAADDGRIAGDNAGRWPDLRAQPRRTPLSVVFCDPQMAIAGTSHAELQASGVAFGVGEVSFADQGRSRVMGRNAGALRVYGARADGRFLGAEMLGPAAEHIAHLLAWSVQRGDTVQQMLQCPFYHPVVEEGLRTALRELQRDLHMGPPPVERCLDCGPGA
jgi:dihydrolipoamide dehydrogenase